MSSYTALVKYSVLFFPGGQSEAIVSSVLPTAEFISDEEGCQVIETEPAANCQVDVLYFWIWETDVIFNYFVSIITIYLPKKLAFQND